MSHKTIADQPSHVISRMLDIYYVMQQTHPQTAFTLQQQKKNIEKKLEKTKIHVHIKHCSKKMKSNKNGMCDPKNLTVGLS